MNEAPTKQIWFRAVLPLVVTWLFIPLSFLLPWISASRAPYIDLSSMFSRGMYWITQSGGKFGISIIVLIVVAGIVLRRGVPLRRRWAESCVIIVVAAIFGGGGGALNEYFLKELIAIPRPNVIFLAGENGSGPLGMRPVDFYENDTLARRKLLEKVLDIEPGPIPMLDSIKRHWIKQTGYSFPSGHAFTAMFFATFLLSIAATYSTRKSSYVYYLVLPWAITVCYSRSVLRLHTPIDITFGGLLGLVIGIVGWVIARMLIRRLAQAT